MLRPPPPPLQFSSPNVTGHFTGTDGTLFILWHMASTTHAADKTKHYEDTPTAGEAPRDRDTKGRESWCTKASSMATAASG